MAETHGTNDRTAKLEGRPARGTRDFLGQEVSSRRRVMEVIRRTYEEFGFEPLETPALENLDLLLDKYGEEGEKLIFKILKRGDKLQSALTAVARGEGPADRLLSDLGLRYDLTVPLARVVAGNLGRIPMPYKRYQMQPVWRADRPARGRFREFYQCDVDVVGAQAPVPEVELLAAAALALERLGFRDFTIRLNHRELLFGLLASAGLTREAQAQAVVALDKLDKVGMEGVKRELAQRGIQDPAQVLEVFSFSEAARQHPRELLEEASARLGRDESSVTAELAQILHLLDQGPTKDRVVLDPFLARGLSYYTGAIFEIVSPGLSVSLGGGGRYDELITKLVGRSMPACGISLGLERILEILSRDQAGPEAGFVDLVVTCWDQGLLAESLRVAMELRGSGLRVDVYQVPGKLKKQLKYAARRRAPLALILGPDEVTAGKAAVKDLRSGSQDIVDRSDLASYVRKKLAQGESGGR